MIYLWVPEKRLWVNAQLIDTADTMAHSEPCQTSKMERFTKIINFLKLFAIFAKRSTIDAWQSSEYAYKIYYIRMISKARKGSEKNNPEEHNGNIYRNLGKILLK